MKIVKRVLAAVIALALMMTAAGCSTPKDAAKVGDVNIPTGEYLAYLYANSMGMYNMYAQYMGDASGMWEQSFPYENPYDFSEDKQTTETTSATSDATSAADENTLIMADYLKQQTKDQIVYFAVLKKILEENGLSISAEDLADADTYLATMDATELLNKGISKEHFKTMYVDTTYMEDTVFNGIYGVDAKGKNATKKADVDKYFADNYIAYEIIQVALVDSDKNPLTDKEIAEKKEELEGYRNVFYATGDFNKAIEAYDAATTVNSDGEIPALDKEKYDVDYDGEPVEDVTALTSTNVQTVDVTAESTDQDLVKMVKSLDEGAVDILEYNQNGGSKMAALVYRVDPDNVKVNPNGYASAEDDVSTYVPLRENVQDAILHSLRDKDFHALVKAKMDEQKSSISFDSRAIKMCDPKNFFE